MFDFDVRSLSQTYRVDAISMEQSVLPDIDMSSSCDYGGREALQCNGLVFQWEQFLPYICFKFSKFVS